jgi:hypothetical protein
MTSTRQSRIQRLFSDIARVSSASVECRYQQFPARQLSETLPQCNEPDMRWILSLRAAALPRVARVPMRQSSLGA